MAKLLDISGLWIWPDGDDFEENNIWQGHILLEEDGWFEGIVVNTNSSYKEDKFVYGFYTPEKYIELFKIVPSKVGSNFVYYGSKDAMGYGGHYEAFGSFGFIACGNSYLFIRDTQLSRSYPFAINDLKMRIKNYKKQNMDEESQRFYYYYFSRRSELCQINFEVNILPDDEEMSKAI